MYARPARRLSWLTLTLALAFAAAAGARDPATAISVTEDGRTHELALTGRDERKVLIFRVYEIAHYAEMEGESPFSVGTVVADGPAKAISITFARRIGMNQIRDEFRSSLRRNAEPEWLVEAQKTLTEFMRAINRDAQKGDELVFYWLPGGRIYAEFNGEREFAATDMAFAKLIWSIWFGADPVCDREELLALRTAETAQ